LIARRYARLGHYEGDGDHALDRIVGADHRAFGDRRVARDDLLHLPGRETMARDIDDVVGTPHDVNEAVGVDMAGIAGLVKAWKSLESPHEARVIVPERRIAARRQRRGDRDMAARPGGSRLTLVAEHREAEARHGKARAACAAPRVAESEAGRRRRPAEFGLPPMVDYRQPQSRLGPFERIGIGALAGEEHRAQPPGADTRDESAVGILLADRADRGRRGEED